MDIYNIIGFFGTGLYILSYLLLQLDKIDSGLIYTVINFFAATFVMISLLEYWNGPSFIIQAVWICISSFGIYKHLKNKNKDKDKDKD